MGRQNMQARESAAGAAARPSTVQRRHERLRRTIFEQAGILFEENGGEDGNGFEATTVEAIAARSEISTRTFFRHFESKADVIYLDLRRSEQEYFEALDKRLPAVDLLSAAVLARIDQFEVFARTPANLTRLRRALRARHFLSRRASWYVEFQDKLQQRLLPHAPAGPGGVILAALAAAMTIKLGEMGLFQWASDGGKGGPADAIAQIALWCQEMFGNSTELRRAIIEEKKIKPRLLGAPKGKS